MAKYHSRLVYVDGFAGPGVYEGGEPGSPIIALKAYLDHSQRSRIDGTELVYVFIEEHAERITRLEEEVHKLSLPKNVRVIISRGAFQDMFGQVLDHVEERGANLAPTFAFIDPFGYSAAPMSSLAASCSSRAARCSSMSRCVTSIASSEWTIRRTR